MSQIDIKIKVQNDNEHFVKEFSVDDRLVLDSSDPLFRSMLDETISIFNRPVDEVSCRVVMKDI